MSAGKRWQRDTCKKNRMCVCVCLSACVSVQVDLGRLGLQGHQAGGSVCQHMEVRGGRWTHGCGPALRVHLVVNQTPLLQECMDSVAEEAKSINLHSHAHFHVWEVVFNFGVFMRF